MMSIEFLTKVLGFKDNQKDTVEFLRSMNKRITIDEAYVYQEFDDPPNAEAYYTPDYKFN
jgi:hypothetical protein